MLKDQKIEICSHYMKQVTAMRAIELGPRKVNVYDGEVKTATILLYKDGAVESFLSMEKNSIYEVTLPKEYYHFNKNGQVNFAIHFDEGGDEEFLFKCDKNEIYTEYLLDDPDYSEKKFKESVAMICDFVDHINIEYPPSNRRVSRYPSRKVS